MRELFPLHKPGVDLAVRVASFGAKGPEFECPSAVEELTPGGVDSACHPAEVGEMSTIVLETGGTASAAQLHSQ